MITVADAVKKLKATYPKLTVLAGCNLNKDFYVFSAVPDTKKTYVDPYYTVNKKTGEVLPFEVGKYWGTFVDACANRVVYGDTK